MLQLFNKSVRRLFSKSPYNYLHSVGWFNSAKSQQSVDGEGNYIPWQNYSFVEFLTPRLNKNMRMFEYGSGHSTLYYSEFVGELIAVESRVEWQQKILPQASDNVDIIVNDDGFVEEIANHGKFDVVIVDSKQRHRCLYFAIDYLSADGVLILDDSERKRYDKIFKRMKREGFKRLDISGISPIVPDRKSTTIFYKDNNCLDI